MQELLAKLGIDWRLLLSQAANFLLLIVILRAFVYKPVLAILKKRREKIEEGVQKAERADLRLKEAGMHAVEKIKEAEREGLELRKQAAIRAKQEEAKLLVLAHEKETQLLKKAKELSERKAREAEEKIHREAGALIREAITKVVELKPDAIDDALINEVVHTITKRA